MIEPVTKRPSVLRDHIFMTNGAVFFKTGFLVPHYSYLVLLYVSREVHMVPVTVYNGTVYNGMCCTTVVCTR